MNLTLCIFFLGCYLFELDVETSVPIDPRNFDPYGTVKFAQKKSINKRFKVVPGKYAIIPCTYQQDQEGAFMLRIFTEGYYAKLTEPEYLGKGYDDVIECSFKGIEEGMKEGEYEDDDYDDDLDDDLDDELDDDEDYYDDEYGVDDK